MPDWGGAASGAASGALTGLEFGGPWGALAGGVIGGLGGLFGGGKAKVGPTSPTFRRAEQIGDLSKEFGFDYALPEGKKLLSGAEATLQKPEDYYSKLLSGNRAEMMGAVAPEVQTIADQFAQNKANISKFTPQGGGQTALLSELPFQQSRATTELLEKVRPEAAKGLERLGAEKGALSGMVTGEGLQGGQLALSAVADQMNALLGKANQDIPLAQQQGAGMFQVLKNLMGPGGALGGQVSTGGLTTGADPGLESAVGGVLDMPGFGGATPPLLPAPSIP